MKAATRGENTGYFADLTHPSSWKILAYFALSVLLMLLYVGVLLVVVSSVVILLITFGLGGGVFSTATYLMVWMAQLERNLARDLLGANLPDMQIPKFKLHITDWARAQWLNLDLLKTAIYLLLYPFLVAVMLVGVAILLCAALFLLTLPLQVLWHPSSVFWEWRDAIVWTGHEGLMFTTFSTVLAFVAGIPALVLAFSAAKMLALGWGGFAGLLLDQHNSAQRSLEALELGSALVLQDDPDTAIKSILLEGIKASSARGARVGQLSINLEPDEIQHLDSLEGTVLVQPFLALEQVLSLPLGQTYLQAIFKNTSPHSQIKNSEVKLWEALSHQVESVLHIKNLLEQAQAHGGELERQRIARELHDSVAQALYGIALGARSAQAQLERNPAKAREALEYAIALADGGTAEMRTLLFALRPDALEEGGLVVALEQLGGMLHSRYKLASSVNAPLEPSVALEVKGALYRIAQEAVHNAVKHAHAQHISISLLDGILEITDNGVGFDTNAARTGTLGLKSMQERASSIKATFRITSQKDIGSRVQVQFEEEKA